MIQPNQTQIIAHRTLFERCDNNAIRGFHPSTAAIIVQSYVPHGSVS